MTRESGSSSNKFWKEHPYTVEARWSLRGDGVIENLRGGNLAPQAMISSV